MDTEEKSGEFNMCMRKIERELVKKAVFKGSILLFYSPIEIARMTQSSLSNISKELKIMVKKGILKENSIIPHKKTYRLSREYLKKNYFVIKGDKIRNVNDVLED